MEAEIPTPENRTMAMLCHLLSFSGYVIPIPLVAVIAPLILWSMKKEESEFIDHHGRESINFQLSILIYVTIGVVLICAYVGFLLLPAIGAFAIVMPIIAAVKANQGEWYRYPLCIRFF
ncbi:DUF4870 domain-containing protein [Blastopirellula sp. JC732]|uniref:DUF4870 domain-containing protein n=1 Tax=Blastopirellula sediminis TaxID=2894196 RepID=A0A9X1SH98_9BACT|nr:DUF4870 domain-containing protein [Blastopirellula sediminis]MCC9607131.1 DUF4870 domain-containing protein [Blastopirellula sediminis]MCC9629576.1 DUF4870 domain-containing protein [Blastopirellula sediminis]